MKYSVIIQSYLGHYDGAAKNREQKLIRAVDSVLNQTLKDFEIVIVADGCEKTFDIIAAKYKDEPKVDCYLIQKQRLWSGHARNFGIGKATGHYIVYLDIDDLLGENHLEKIDKQIKDNDWVWFNDILKQGNIERQAYIDRKYQNGTSNICHKRSLAVKWNGIRYGDDDWSIVKELLRYKKNQKIETPEYYVMHLPSKMDL